MDAVDLDSLAWRAVELAVQRRQDPRLIVATRRTIGGPRATARLVAGLCNAAAGRRAVAVFGIDGIDIVGLARLPDEAWLDTVASRFPGVVPALAVTTIDADGAHIVALAAEDPGTPVIATRAGRAVVPWFDGELVDRPPPAGTDHHLPRPPGRIELRTGWLERDHPCRPVGVRPTGATNCAAAHPIGAAGVGVWRGVLDGALAVDEPADASGGHARPDEAPVDAAALRGDGDRRADAARTERLHGSRSGRTGRPVVRPGRVAIADRDVSVTLLADGSSAAVSLDVQIHPMPGGVSAARAEGGILIEPMVPVRLYLAAADAAVAGDSSEDHGSMVRLLVSLRFPGDERLVATIATLRRDDTTSARRWVL